MKQRLKQAIMAFAVLVGVATTFSVVPVGAVDPIGDACANNSSSTICQNSDDSAGEIVKTVVNVLLFIVGILSVIMIIVGGLRYTTSGGDAGAVTSAKNTIMYAVIGLVVAFLAFAIVNWVLGIFAPPATP